MLVRLIILIFSGSLLLFFSCRKNSNTISNSQLVGKWVWVSDNIGNQVLTDTLNSAVRKSIFFKGNGVFILTHNDSTSNGSTLQVISNLVVLPVAVSDTGSFQIFLQTGPNTLA
jgi:hypothetical protein